MPEINKAKRLIEAATSDNRVIAGEIAAIGFACIYLYKRRSGSEVMTDEDLSATVVSEPLDDGNDTIVFAHSHKSIEQGVPFKFGISTKLNGKMELIAVSGVKLAKGISDKWSSLSVPEDSNGDLTSLELLKAKLQHLKEQFDHPENPTINPAD